MLLFRVAVLFACVFLLPPDTVLAADGPSAGRVIEWRELEPGLALARVPVTFLPSRRNVSPEGDEADARDEPDPAPISVTATVLRIDPARFAFSLYMASESGLKPLGDISESENFVAAINAGMYQRDHRTNTGHLRSPSHTNNPHVAANFGAFFVAEPRDGALPPARLLDRQADDWEAALGQYGVVMQNYRMSTPDGRVIWRQVERQHSIAALGQDPDGNILFLLCPDPVPAADFLEALLRLPLGLGTVMYLEGGSEAALLVNAGGVRVMETGGHSLWTSPASLMLPNVLGIRRRPEASP